MNDLKKTNDTLLAEISGYKEQYNHLTAKMLAEFVMKDCDKNIFYSPFSVLVLLSIAADSVDGKTREEILEVIGGDISYEDLREMIVKIQDTFAEGEDLVSANAVCVKEEIRDTITSGYLEKLSDYGGRLFATNDIVNDVNHWVKENTNGMIEKIADDSMSEILAVLINAVAFQAIWERKYSEDEVYGEEFTNADGTISEVTFLHSTEARYIEDVIFTGFVKRYKNNDHCFMALLPKEEKSGKQLADIIKGIDFTEIYKSTSFSVCHHEYKDEAACVCRCL